MFPVRFNSTDRLIIIKNTIITDKIVLDLSKVTKRYGFPVHKLNKYKYSGFTITNSYIEKNNKQIGTFASVVNISGLYVTIEKENFTEVYNKSFDFLFELEKRAILYDNKFLIESSKLFDPVTNKTEDFPYSNVIDCYNNTVLTKGNIYNVPNKENYFSDHLLGFMIPASNFSFKTNNKRKIYLITEPLDKCDCLYSIEEVLNYLFIEKPEREFRLISSKNLDLDIESNLEMIKFNPEFLNYQNFEPIIDKVLQESFAKYPPETIDSAVYRIIEKLNNLDLSNENSDYAKIVENIKNIYQNDPEKVKKYVDIFYQDLETNSIKLATNLYKHLLTNIYSLFIVYNIEETDKDIIVYSSSNVYYSIARYLGVSNYEEANGRLCLSLNKNITKY